MFFPPAVLFGAALGASLAASPGAHPVLRVSDSVPTLNVEQVCQGIAQQGGVTFHDAAVADARQRASLALAIPKIQR